MVNPELPFCERMFDVWSLWTASAGYRLASAWAVRRTMRMLVTGVDSVRILARLAVDVLDVRGERGVPCGPVLDNWPRRVVEFVVPMGAAEVWLGLECTRCTSTVVVRCAAPSVTAANDHGHVDGRLWLTAPAPPPAPRMTDADGLADVDGIALARSRSPHISGSREAQP